MNKPRRAFIRQSLLLPLWGGLGVLAGCGFQLRKPTQYAFKTLYSNVPLMSPFGATLSRGLERDGTLEVINDPKQVERAEVIFEQLAEMREKAVVGRTASGAIREFQLRLRYRFRLRNREGIELIPDTEILLVREISYNETGALSKEAEEGLLYRDMEQDLIAQIQRRLAAIQQL